MVFGYPLAHVFTQDLNCALTEMRASVSKFVSGFSFQKDSHTLESLRAGYSEPTPAHFRVNLIFNYLVSVKLLSVLCQVFS